MLNNYFISPIHYSHSIFLTYHGDQPFASFGSKTLMPGVTSVCLPSAPPLDNQPRGLVTEFLHMCPFDGFRKVRRWKRIEAGPTGKRKNLYRMDPRSQYAVPLLDVPLIGWHTATVSFEAKRVHMLWRDCTNWTNPLATNFAQQEDTVLPAYFHGASITVGSTAYLVLRQMWKPVVDIHTTKYPFASDFEREVRPLIKGWWHAIRIASGWRLYADDKDQLMWAKLKIRTQ